MITAGFPQINHISDSAHDKLFKMGEPVLDFDWMLEPKVKQETATRDLSQSDKTHSMYHYFNP